MADKVANMVAGMVVDKVADKVADMATDMVSMFILGTVDVDVFFAHISKVQIK